MIRRFKMAEWILSIQHIHIQMEDNANNRPTQKQIYLFLLFPYRCIINFVFIANCNETKKHKTFIVQLTPFAILSAVIDVADHKLTTLLLLFFLVFCLIFVFVLFFHLFVYGISLYHSCRSRKYFSQISLTYFSLRGMCFLSVIFYLISLSAS